MKRLPCIFKYTTCLMHSHEMETMTRETKRKLFRKAIKKMKRVGKKNSIIAGCFINDLRRMLMHMNKASGVRKSNTITRYAEFRRFRTSLRRFVRDTPSRLHNSTRNIEGKRTALRSCCNFKMSHISRFVD